METLREVLEEQVQDVYNAENQLTKALPKMAKKASTPELKEAFTMHLEETKVHVERLAQVAKLLGIKPTGKVCKAMKGLVEEGSEVLEEDGKNAAIDAALIAAAQRVEHYEMAAYGTLRTLAEVLGHNEVIGLLDETLDEEKAADAKLTEVAEQNVYPGAPKNEGDEDEELVTSSKGKSKGGSKGGKKSGGSKKKSR
jgi:ferritin-like metal-binding protein YciE